MLISPESIDMLKKNRWYLRLSIIGNLVTGIVSAITMIIVSVLLLSFFFGAGVKSESDQYAEVLFFLVGVLISMLFISISVQFHHVLLTISASEGQSGTPSESADHRYK